MYLSKPISLEDFAYFMDASNSVFSSMIKDLREHLCNHVMTPEVSAIVKATDHKVATLLCFVAIHCRWGRLCPDWCNTHVWWKYRNNRVTTIIL